MHSKRTLVLFLGLTFSLTGMALAAGKGRLIGTVVDPVGRPISEVTVTLTSKENPSFREVDTTDKKGIFNIKLSSGSAVYHFQLEKEGHRPFEGALRDLTPGTKRFEFTMHPGGSSTEVVDEDQGEQVIETACFRTRDVRHYVGLHNSYVYVQCERNEHYLLTMWGVCIGLRGSLKISVSGSAERICSETTAAVLYEDQNNNPVACRIRRVEEVEGETEAQQLAEFRMEVHPN